jgi:hypothetical protein
LAESLKAVGSGRIHVSISSLDQRIGQFLRERTYVYNVAVDLRFPALAISEGKKTTWIL